MLKDEFVKQVGNSIRKKREQKKLTLEELANVAGIEYSQLSRIEKGKINTSIFCTYNIANALEISITDLFHFAE